MEKTLQEILAGPNRYVNGHYESIDVPPPPVTTIPTPLGFDLMKATLFLRFRGHQMKDETATRQFFETRTQNDREYYISELLKFDPSALTSVGDLANFSPANAKGAIDVAIDVAVASNPKLEVVAEPKKSNARK